MDRDLVEQAQAGDQTAFMALVRSRGDQLFSIAQRILRDVDRAEDALQDALVIAWRDLPGLRDPDRFDAWVHRVLTNVCIAQAARERRRAANLRVMPLDGPPAPDALLGIVDRDQLDRGFRRLTPEERAILVLHHYVGYAPSEIAELLGSPPGTVRSRLHHAHRAMRAALDAEDPRLFGRRNLGMNEHTDIERVLERWFDDGPSTMPDRVVVVVADRIDRQRQRRPWRLPWRPPRCPSDPQARRRSAAVLLIALVGYQFVREPAASASRPPHPDSPRRRHRPPRRPPPPPQSASAAFPASAHAQGTTDRRWDPACGHLDDPVVQRLAPRSPFRRAGSTTWTYPGYGLFPDSKANEAEYASSGEMANGIFIVSVESPYFDCEASEHTGGTAAERAAFVVASDGFAGSEPVDVTMVTTSDARVDADADPDGPLGRAPGRRQPGACQSRRDCGIE